MPARAWMDFRLESYLGNDGGYLKAADLVSYLKWCRRMRRRAR
jgi:hypothetical protein